MQEESNGNNVNSLTSLILALLLSWLHPTIVRLHLQQSGRIFLFGSSPSAPAAVMHRSFQALSNGLSQDILNQFLHQNGRASASWTSISATTSSLSMQGIISMESNSTKNVQFISFGIKPLRPTTGWDEVYDHLNRLFSDSSFGTVESDEPVRHSANHSYKRPSFCKNRPTNDYKAHSRWPMF